MGAEEPESCGPWLSDDALRKGLYGEEAAFLGKKRDISVSDQNIRIVKPN